MPESSTPAASQTTLVRTINFAPTPPTTPEQSPYPPSRSRAHLPKALSLVPVKLTSLPRKELIIAEAEQLLYDSHSWKPAKSYNNTQTYTHTLPTYSSSGSPPSDMPWCCVAHEFTTTTHTSSGGGNSTPLPDAPHSRESNSSTTPTLFTRLWTKMSIDRIHNQQLYTPEIKSVNDIKTLSKTQSIWSVSYDFGSPLSPRVVTMLQIVKLIDTVPGARTGIAIAIPVNLNSSSENLAVLEDLGVKSRFVIAEHLKEYEGGKVVEWRKIMCGEFGGLVPKFCVRRSMPEKLALDAQRFIQWVVQSEDTDQQQQQREDEEEPKLEIQR